jgi:hypothetical protein
MPEPALRDDGEQNAELHPNRRVPNASKMARNAESKIPENLAQNTESRRRRTEPAMPRLTPTACWGPNIPRFDGMNPSTREGPIPGIGG